MCIRDSNEEIKTKHKGDIPTLWRIYVSEKPFYKNLFFLLSFAIAILMICLTCFSSTPTYTTIVKITKVILDIMPNLLGFNLGAYILIVGFGSTEILSFITAPLEKKSNFSFYQILNGVLGISVIVQILTLLFAFIINYWDGIQSNFNSLISNIILIRCINYLGLFLLLFFSIYSILLLVNVVKHVFMFAQTVHLCVYKVKSEKENQQNQQNVDEQKNINNINVVIENIDINADTKKEKKK